MNTTDAILDALTKLQRRVNRLETLEQDNSLLDLALDPVIGHRHLGLEDDGPRLSRFETAYNDLVIPISTGKIPGAAYPDWTAFTTNTYLYTFDVDDYIDLPSSEILHGWREGTPLECHIHFITNGANNATPRTVKYTLYYSIGDMGEVMAAEDSKTGEATIPALEADRTHHYLDLGDIAGLSYKIGAVLTLRLKRVASTGTEPANAPFVANVGIHYEIDAIGSRQEGVKD